jgi:hypothetical protein
MYELLWHSVLYFLLYAEFVSFCLYGNRLGYWCRVSSLTEGPSTRGRTNRHWLGRDETNWGESGAAWSVHALLILVLAVYWKIRNCIFFPPPSLPKQFGDSDNIGLVLNVHEETEILLVNLKYVLTPCLVNISSYIWHSEDHASWYILIIKANEIHYFSNLF